MRKWVRSLEWRRLHQVRNRARIRDILAQGGLGVGKPVGVHADELEQGERLRGHAHEQAQSRGRSAANLGQALRVFRLLDRVAGPGSDRSVQTDQAGAVVEARVVLCRLVPIEVPPGKEGGIPTPCRVSADEDGFLRVRPFGKRLGDDLPDIVHQELQAEFGQEGHIRFTEEPLKDMSPLCRTVIVVIHRDAGVSRCLRGIHAGEILETVRPAVHGPHLEAPDLFVCFGHRHELPADVIEAVRPTHEAGDENKDGLHLFGRPHDFGPVPCEPYTVAVPSEHEASRYLAVSAGVGGLLDQHLFHDDGLRDRIPARRLYGSLGNEPPRLVAGRKKEDRNNQNPRDLQGCLHLVPSPSIVKFRTCTTSYDIL